MQETETMLPVGAGIRLRYLQQICWLIYKDRKGGHLWRPLAKALGLNTRHMTALFALGKFSLNKERTN